MNVKHILAALLILTSFSDCYSQGDQKIATTYNYNIFGYGMPQIDSTAFYYDRSGALRSSVSYIFPYLTGVWKPGMTTIFPVRDPGTEESLTYRFSEKSGKWEKENRRVSTASPDGRLKKDETYYWNPDKGEFVLSYQGEVEQKFSGEKIVQIRTSYCTSCGDNGNKYQWQETYFYDANDSLVAMEDRLVPAGTLRGRTTYTYHWENGLMVKTQRNFSAFLLEFSRVVNRYQQGKLVSSRYYHVSDNIARLGTLDSFAYDGDNQVYSENSNYYGNDFIQSATQKKTSYNTNGLPTEVITNYMSVNNSSMTLKEENLYNAANALIATNRYSWDSTVFEWVFTNASYNKYDGRERLFESGRFDGTDSVWEVRHYYAIPAATYKPADAGLEVLISPNPIKKRIHADLYSKEYTTIQFSVLDELGRQVISQNYEIKPGPNSIEIIPGTNLKPGIYIYQVKAGGNMPVIGKLMVAE
jgi:hypothetical protein